MQFPCLMNEKWRSVWVAILVVLMWITPFCGVFTSWATAIWSHAGDAFKNTIFYISNCKKMKIFIFQDVKNGLFVGFFVRTNTRTGRYVIKGFGNHSFVDAFCFFP